jgi:trimethylamine--corrinoid protein Co-methyltransferase
VMDQQAGIEAALSLIIDALDGGHIVHDLGYLESGMTGTLCAGWKSTTRRWPWT